MQMLTKDPTKRLTSAELITHPWVCGENLSVKPLPATHERLSAFIKARHAFYGSILMGILAHHLTAATGAEGVGLGNASEFNAFEVGWQLFDRDGKGHIDSQDLHRVCLEMGYKVTMRDVDNMIAVMAPTARNTNTPLPGGASDELAAAEAASMGSHAKISFERYKTTMQASFMRKFDLGALVFKRGDPVDHFYVITRGQCDVLVPKGESVGDNFQTGKVADVQKSVRPGPRLHTQVTDVDATASKSNVGLVDKETGDVCIASLGPGDFFGETGLLEGRQTRAASVICRTPVEVMAMDREIFKQVTGSGEQGNKIADSMRAKADARQRARLTKVCGMR